MGIPIFLITYDKVDRLYEFMRHWENIDDSDIDLYICDNMSENSDVIRDHIEDLYNDRKIAGFAFFDDNIVYNAAYHAALKFAGKEPVIGIFEDDRPFKDVKDSRILQKAKDFILSNDKTLSVLMGRNNTHVAEKENVVIEDSVIDIGKITGSFLIRRREYFRYSKMTGNVLCKWGGSRYLRELGMKSYKLNCVADYGYQDNTDWNDDDHQFHNRLQSCAFITHEDR